MMKRTRFSPERQIQPPERQIQPPEPPHSSDGPSFSSSPGVPSTPFVFPAGYKFVPSEEELVLCYLNPFSQGKNCLANVPIHKVNIYDYNPEYLTEHYIKGNEKQWFFIVEKKNMGPGRKRQRRSDNGGFWHSSRAAQKHRAGNIAFSKTSLEYYSGKPPNAKKGDWLMLQFWIESSHEQTENDNRVDFSLCIIYLSPKAIKKKKEEEEEKEKMKKAKEEAEMKAKEEAEMKAKEEAEQPAEAYDDFWEGLLYCNDVEF